MRPELFGTPRLHRLAYVRIDGYITQVVYFLFCASLACARVFVAAFAFLAAADLRVLALVFAARRVVFDCVVPATYVGYGFLTTATSYSG